MLLQILTEVSGEFVVAQCSFLLTVKFMSIWRIFSAYGLDSIFRSRPFLLRLFAGFNMYCLFVFLFQFIFLSNESFPQIDGKFPVHIFEQWKFPTNRRKISSSYFEQWKFPTNRRKIFHAPKYELENKYSTNKRYILNLANRYKKTPSRSQWVDSLDLCSIVSNSNRG